MRAGCSWRMMPHDLPAWQTVYSYFQRWQRKGVWQKSIQLCDRSSGKSLDETQSHPPEL
ncbi:transposase [[Scytonema hofmanni] UTEX B 1581]|uniref:transposase n=1 Tax=[Scytonema hofmanni] UTEX B 1581 TaxID=379535 RepID=UPI0037DA4B50